MFKSGKHIGLATAAGLAALAFLCTQAWAQSTQGRLSSSGQGMSGRASGSCGQGMSGMSSRGARLSNYPGTSSSLPNPYASYLGQTNTSAGLSAFAPNPYGSSYTESDLSGTMRGAADLISAQGRWMGSLQQAGLLREQNHQATIATRRQDFDQYFNERARTPTFEQERERSVAQDLRRSLNDPPTSDIWSGQALNVVLGDLARRLPDDASGPAVALDEEVLRHINLTAGRGSAGLFKNEGRLSWPPALRDDAYKTEREQLDSLAPEAIFQAINGQADAATVQSMTKSVERLRKKLGDNIKYLTSSEFIDSNRFLTNLDDGLRVLSRPNAGDHFTSKYTAKGRTVAELVKQMITSGLKFAPAVPGDGAAYVALHRALVAYDTGLSSPVIAER